MNSIFSIFLVFSILLMIPSGLVQASQEYLVNQDYLNSSHREEIKNFFLNGEKEDQQFLHREFHIAQNKYVQFSSVLKCEFLPNEKVNGFTPKLYCLTQDEWKTKIKVKYGRDNPELLSEVAASRLARVFGIPADRHYVLKTLHCFACPTDPWKFYQSRDPILLTNLYVPFLNVVAEVKLHEGSPYEKVEDFIEIFDSPDNLTSQQKAQREAAVIFQALINNWDNKKDNQRALTVPQEAFAPKYVYVHDLGAGFAGKKTSNSETIKELFGDIKDYGGRKVNFQRWINSEIWKDRSCEIQITGSVPFFRRFAGTKGSEKVSEAGVSLLADRIRNIFYPKDVFDKELAEALFLGAQFNLSRTPDIELWARGLKYKMDQILKKRCP